MFEPLHLFGLAALVPALFALGFLIAGLITGNFGRKTFRGRRIIMSLALTACFCWGVFALLAA